MIHLFWVYTLIYILTFSSELKMFLNKNDLFEVENIIILLESSKIGGIYIDISANKLLVQSVVYTIYLVDTST